MGSGRLNCRILELGFHVTTCIVAKIQILYCIFGVDFRNMLEMTHHGDVRNFNQFHHVVFSLK